jgi:hypothetical protein
MGMLARRQQALLAGYFKVGGWQQQQQLRVASALRQALLWQQL